VITLAIRAGIGMIWTHSPGSAGQRVQVGIAGMVGMVGRVGRR
jgi:hypothetical protein